MSDTIPQDTPQRNLTPKTTFIYVLIDPETNEVRYVGKANDPEHRFYNHLYQLKDDTYKNRWVRNLLARGLKPVMQVIDEVPYAQWPQWECHWITYYREQGSPLTNTATGGIGGSGTPSPETRAKLSAINKGKKHKPMSEEARRNIGEGHRGLKMSEEAKTKIGNSHRGKHVSSETRAKLSESHKGQVPAMKGRKHTPETLAKLSAMRRGVKHGPMSEEQKRKISEAQIGKYVSAETRARLSASHMGQKSARKGQHHTPESRAKMSVSKQKRIAMKNTPFGMPTLWD